MQIPANPGPPVLQLSEATADCLLPRSQVTSWQWLKENGRLEDGRPLNLRDYPWFRAVCEAYDDPRVRTIAIQGAVQIGKTVICRNLLCCATANMAGGLMFATATMDLAKNYVKKKLYPTLEEIPATRPGLPPPHHYNSLGPVDCGQATIYVAWSGSPSKLGDLTIRVAHHGELDKWSREESDEADPEDLADKRFAAVPDHKCFKESTPTIEGGSRINRRLNVGSNGRWVVPCSKCGAYQELVFGDGSGGGVIFDKNADGELDADLAEQTARYRCSECTAEWPEEARMPAVREGVYRPEGCEVNKRGELEGEPLRPWPHWSIQVSRLYSPASTLGVIAREFCEAKLSGDPDKLRDFRNSTEGLCFSPIRSVEQWDTVAARLCAGGAALGRAPASVLFCTAGVDVQIDHVVYWVAGWDRKQSGWLLDYGICSDWDQLEQLLTRTYHHADGGEPLSIGLTLVDSRYEQIENEVVSWCQKVNRPGARYVWPSQGAKAGAMAGCSFRRRELDEGDPRKKTRRPRRKMADFYIVTVNTNYWQAYADRCLYELHPGDPGAFSFPAAVRADEDLFSQLTNQRAVPGKSGPMVWRKIREGAPKDFRDCWRYARCAAEVYTLGAWSRLTDRRPGQAKPAARPQTGPGGKPSTWFRRPPAKRRPPRR